MDIFVSFEKKFQPHCDFSHLQFFSTILMPYKLTLETISQRFFLIHYFKKFYLIFNLGFQNGRNWVFLAYKILFHYFYYTM
jgi:hypothetical protein